jgi:hypothetical protein
MSAEFVDNGTAPELFATHIHRIDDLGHNRRIVFGVQNLPATGR